MPNFQVGTIFASTPRQASADIASSTIIALSALSDTMRVGLVITNLSTGTVYLTFGSHVAIVGMGIPLLASGGSWSMDEYSFTPEAVQAISHANGSALAIQEFYK